MANILLVDDDDLLRSTICARLQLEGHIIQEADDGEKALKLASANNYDLVITDILMPVCDGLELARGIRDSGSTSKIIAMSGGGVVIPADQALHWSTTTGVDATLEKPFRSNQLLVLIGELMAGVCNSQPMLPL